MYIRTKRDPVHSRLFSFMLSIALDYTTVVFDGSDRSDIIVITPEHDSIESYFSCFYESESEHLCGISLSAFCRDYTVTDMSPRLTKEGGIYRVPYVNRAEDFSSCIESEEQCRRHLAHFTALWFGIGKLQKFFKILPSKEGARRCRDFLMFLPFLDHGFIGFFMR